MKRVAALVAAAGQSRRFGADKRLQPLAAGDTLLESSIRLYTPVCQPVLVTLRGDDFALRERLQKRFPDIACLLVSDAGKGMGAGLASAAASGLLDARDGLLIALGDMPFIRRETLELLLAAFAARAGGGVILRPGFRGKEGHPVLFDGCHLAALRRLSGETGARPVLRANAERLVVLPVADAGVVRDIDLPAELP